MHKHAKLYFVLGCSDPEMRLIESYLALGMSNFTYAHVGGKRVHPGNAYEADPVCVPDGYTDVWIECASKVGTRTVVIDHHREGDPGFGLGPEQYWEASSIGQFFKLIEFDGSTVSARAIAAMDHCFSAAAQGSCPGITPQDVIAVKNLQIAEALRLDIGDVAVRTEQMREKIHDAPFEKIGTQVFRDLRAEYFGEGYSLDLLTMQLAATCERVGVILHHRDVLNGPRKWSLSGEVMPETVDHFIKEWAPKQGLINTYGVPARGYAGGYLPG